MKKTSSSKKSAFSLIELSIVLIIIGLLIAGITGGASLIKSSELRSVMGEARGYAVAVNAFYTQFNGLPGDYSNNGVGIGAGLAGDNDGAIEYFNTQTATTTLTASESSNAWATLKATGGIDTITNTGAPVAATTQPSFGVTAPASKIKASGWVFDYRVLPEYNGLAANQNVVILTGTMITASTAGAITPAGNGSVPLVALTAANNSAAAINGADALSIDNKLDDGLANYGKVRGLNPATVSATAATTCYTQASVGTTGTPVLGIYVTTSTAKTCALTYQVDVNS